MRTIVCQSYRTERVPPWITRCIETVRGWAALRGHEYEFVGDEILDLLPAWYREKAMHRWPVMTDLGRLILLRAHLEAGYDRAIWLDADVLVFDPDHLELACDEGYLLGREVWVERDDRGRIRIRRNVHNAVCVFDRTNPMLAFYEHACKRILTRVSGGVPEQIVGTKFLTALHHMVDHPLTDEVAMFSPAVIADLHAGGGEALDRLRAETPGRICAANLCASLADRVVAVEVIEELCQMLLIGPTSGLSSHAWGDRGGT